MVLNKSSKPIDILLVEDNPGDIRIILEMLKEAKNVKFKITHAKTLNESLKILGDGRYEVILLDLGLPDSQGIDTLKKVGSLAPGLPIIILAGLEDERVALEAIQEGAQDYLYKNNLNTELLVRALRYALERKKSETAFRESEEKYRQLVDNSFVGIYISQKNKVQYCNQRFSDIFGFQSPAELIGENIKKLVAPNYWGLVKGEVNLRKSGKKKLSSYEFEGRKKDGTAVFLEVLGSTIIYLDEFAFQGVLIDITGRKEMEKELEHHRHNLEIMVEERTKDLNAALKDSENSRDRIDIILKSVAEGLIVTDINHHILLLNSLAEDWLDVRLSDVINRTIDSTIKDMELRKKMKQSFMKLQKGEQLKVSFDWTWKNKTFEVSTRTIIDRDRSQSGVLTALRDVTWEREVDRMKTDFISTAAHELRTPLTSIQGFSEILQTRDNLSGKERSRFLNYINKQSVVLGKIISDLLDISRIESRIGFTLNRQKYITGDIIKEIVPTMQSVSPKHNFILDLPVKPAEIFADKDKIEQVIINLLSNAVKYSPENSDIRVTGKVTNNWYTVIVADNGIGMTPDQVDKIFNKFYRADTPDISVEGIGLGMSIVKYIIDAHGGRIRINSKPGIGTKVHFTVPLFQVKHSGKKIRTNEGAS